MRRGRISCAAGLAAALGACGLLFAALGRVAGRGTRPELPPCRRIAAALGLYACRLLEGAAAHLRSNPALPPFYGLLGAWALLGLLTLFVGMLGLLFQLLLFLVVCGVALAVCFQVARHPTRAAQAHALVALGVGAVLVVSCPNNLGPDVYFARHGAELDTFAREIAAARCDLWIEARPYADPPYNVTAAVAGRYRATLQRIGAVSVERMNGWVIFVIDGFADNCRGVIFVGDGAPPPELGYDFSFGRVVQLVPLSRPGWYFFATT